MSSPTHTAPEIPFELQSLAEAHRYQKWLIDVARPHLGSRILELGSGIGNLSQHLPVRERLILSDIDPGLVQALERKLLPHESGRVSVMRLQEPSPAALGGENLDTVVSFNVLEHVEDDVKFMGQLIGLLRESGASGPKRIVTLVPAHPWAYGAIDREFGHYRRYSDSNFRRMLEEAGAGKLSRGNYYSRYMNLPGLLGWWLNGKVLGKSKIGAGNVKAFERLCPFIRPVDDFVQSNLRFPMGNSLLAVYRVDRG
jgi:SAM-dependent methyltransferase